MNLEHPIGAARNYLSRLRFDSLQVLCTAGLQRVLKSPPSWEALLPCKLCTPCKVHAEKFSLKPNVSSSC